MFGINFTKEEGTFIHRYPSVHMQEDVIVFVLFVTADLCLQYDALNVANRHKSNFLKISFLTVTNVSSPALFANIVYDVRGVYCFISG